MNAVMTFKRILCAIDFSEPSHEAMMVAASMAVDVGAKLALVHVWQAPFLAQVGAMVTDEMLAKLTEAAASSLAAAKLEVEGAGVSNVDTKLLAGAPWDRIVDELTSDPSYDLVVMGTQGRTGLKRVLLGSVAENVVRHAPCAVLVIRRRETLRT